MIEEASLNIIDWIETVPPLGLYCIFFLVAYVENILPPIPGDLLVAFSGFLAAEQTIHFLPVYFLTTIASVIGFMSVFAVGSYFGQQIKQNPKRIRVFRYIKFKHFAKAESWMGRWGQYVVAANRFLPGMRSVIAIAAGVSHTPPILTALNSLISSLAWNLILIYSGWLLHENWELVGHYLSVYSRIILILLVVVVLGTILFKFFRNRSKRKHIERQK